MYWELYETIIIALITYKIIISILRIISKYMVINLTKEEKTLKQNKKGE